MESDNNKRICLNCGAENSGNFCPICGQSLATGRFTMHSFAVHLFSALTRVSGAFLRTAWGLLRHPWVVVRDYVYGRRVGLVSPVTMLLLLALYWGVVMAVVPHFNQTAQLEGIKAGTVMKWLYGSLTFQYLFLALPIALGTWAVYHKDIKGKFNFAELLIATLYLACTFLMVDFLLSPVEMLNEVLGNILIVAATGTYGILSIMKAFPQASRKSSCLKLACWIAACAMLLFLFLLLFALPMYKDFI